MSAVETVEQAEQSVRRLRREGVPVAEVAAVTLHDEERAYWVSCEVQRIRALDEARIAREYRQHRAVTHLAIGSLVALWVVMVHRIIRWVRS